MEQKTTRVVPAIIVFMLLINAGHAADNNEAVEQLGRYEVHESLRYADYESTLTLDLYVPCDVAGTTACVIVIHAGGFWAQDGQGAKRFADYLAKRGLAVALIANRGRPDHKYRDTITDTKAAVRYVRRNSCKHNIDPDRIGAMGRSGGGALAAILAVTDDKPDFLPCPGPDSHSSRIQAAVCHAGVFDFVARYSDKKQLALQSSWAKTIKTNAEWIGSCFSPADSDWINASAINHVDGDDPPVLFIHCRNDPVSPWLQSKLMRKQMRKAGIPSRLKIYKHGGHNFAGVEERSMAETVKFFRKTLSR